MCFSQAGLAEQQGQYRSKVLITPGGEMDKGAELSIEELEKQISSIQQPYAKSSAGRHLARHYVEAKEYGKAIEYYQTALAAQGLSDVANREMLRELAQVYLLSEDYPAAAKTLERALRIDLVPEVTDYLLLAQAHYKMGKYVAVVAALDRMQEKRLTLTTVQMRQALALYYSAGAYAQCEKLLRHLLELEPNSPDNWHQLVSVYLQQNKKRQALDQLALAWEKSVPFTERDILLLADLQAYNKNPYGAAELLAQAMGRGKVKANGANYRKLFQFWLLAREKDKSGRALMKAAQLSGDIELYLYLAQLQMEQRDWQPMHQTMLAACANQLEDKYVGRANLLLGVSQLKLGDNVGARRSFINATLIGGANAQAGQWLEFMDAEPTTKDEARRIVGICYGAQDKRAKVASTPSGRSATTAEKGAAEPAGQDGIQIKTVPAMRIFYAKHNIPLTELAAELKSLAVKLNINMVKAGGSAAGPLQIISTGNAAEGGQASFELAIPTRGSPTARGKYRVRKLASFKCAYLVHEGPGEDLLAAGIDFARALQAAGYELTGERRMVVVGIGGSTKIELQFGIE
jgi:effector-binding domain-containing protein/thioredoxin-like negative regulator of GroEL